MDKPLRILNVEDSEPDSALLSRHLENAGFGMTWVRVETAESFKTALAGEEWDVILCDYAMPQFDAVTALRILHDSGVDIPFIIISGTIGEEIAVEALLAGANDYVPKGNLSRLVPAIGRELQQAEDRRAKRKAEEALKASEAELRALFAAMHDVILVFDRDGHTLKVAPTNPKHIYKRGTDRIGKTVHEIYPADLADFLLTNIQACLDGGRTLELEYSVPIDGSDRWFDGTVTPMTDDSVLWVARDITQRKRAEDELRESEALLAASQRITHLGSWVMEISDSGEVIENSERWSDEHYRIFGFEPGEIAVTDEIFYNSVHPDDRDLIARAINDAVENRKPFDLEHRIILPNGTERVVHALAEIVLDPNSGKPVKLRGSVQDITERKHSEKVLFDSEERYRELVENAHDIIYTHDLSGNYTSVNKVAEEITGFTRDEILAMNIAEAIPGEELETAKKIIAAKLAGEEAPVHEVELRTKDGHGVMVEVNSRIVYEDGVPIGVQGIARDISQRKLLEAQLELQNAEREVLLNSIGEGVHWIDLDGRIRFENPAGAKMLGYESSELIGKPSHTTIHHTRSDGMPYPRTECGIYATLNDGLVRRVTGEVFWRKDGTSFDVEYICTPIFDHDGSVRGSVVVFSDVTERLRAEAESRRLLRVLEGTLNEIYIFDADTLLLEYVNDCAKTNLGYSMEALLQLTPLDLTPEIAESDFQKLIEPLRRRKKTKITFETVHCRADGSLYPVEVHLQFVDQGGKPIFLAVINDITDRMASEKRYQSLFENMIEGYAYCETVFDGDQLIDFVYTEVNESFKNMTGLEDVVGKRISELIPGFAKYNPEVLEIYGRVALTGIPEQFETCVEPLGIWLCITVYSSSRENFVAVFDNITSRKQAEAALRESDEKFHQLADNISDVFWIRSPDMKTIHFISPAYEKIWGRKLRSDYADPHEWYEFIEPVDRQRVKEAYAGLMHDRPEIEVEFRILRPDGEQRWVRARGFQVKDSSGEVIRLAGIVTDITDRKLAIEALAESEERNRELVENAIDIIYTHDLNGNYTSVNRAVERITGYTREESLAMNMADTLAPEYLPKARQMIAEKHAGNDTTAYEVEIIAKNKERVALEVNTRIIYENGVAVGVQGIARDITERKLAQNKLAELTERTEKRERMLTTMLSSMSDMAQIYDPEGRIVFVNQRVLDLWGRTLDDVVGKNFYELEYPADLASKLQKQISQVYRTKTPITDETPFIGANGELGFYEYIFTPAIGPEGKVDFVVGSTREVTERKRAATLLAESQQRLRLATESANIGIWDWDVVEDTMKWDARMYELYGNHDEDFSGPRKTWNLNHHPEDNKRVIEGLVTAFKGPGDFHSEFRVVWPSGEVHHLESSAKVLRDENGRALRFIGVAWDITERKLAEETLREADQRAIREYGLLLTRVSKLALALGNARDLDTVFEELREFALVSTGMDGMIISLFDARKKTRTAAYVWSEGVKVDASSLPPMEMSDSPHSRSVLTGEIIITDDFQSAMASQPVLHLGGDLPQSSLVVPMSVMGKIVGGVEVQSDHRAAFRESHATAMQMAANLAANAIENVRLMENDRHQAEQLRQSQKMEAVGVLAGGIAHDFNNLLTAINGFSDLTLRRMEADNPFRRNIQEVKNAGERAAELTGQLLAFSRKQVLRASVISLNSVISNIENMLRRIIKESVELRVVLDPQLGNVMADPGQIEQVIVNLAINARDAMPNGGNLTIKTKNVYLGDDYVDQHILVSPGEFVRVTVSDNGEGMDAETRSHIFEPFFTTKEVGKGTGLGLSTVYGIVKQSGGTIMVYSELGHGTTFKVYLPCVDRSLELPRWENERETGFSGAETILLVEDEDAVRSFVIEVLESSGYTVLEASNGPDASALCRDHAGPIHLLISDVIMPKMGGAELKNRIVEMVPGIKVLFISGYTDDSIADRGIDDPNVAFLEKPFTPDALIRKVRDVLDTS